MSIVNEFAIQRRLVRAFQVFGDLYAPSLDQIVYPGYDVGRPAIEYDDELVYWATGGNAPAVVANLSVVSIHADGPVGPGFPQISDVRVVVESVKVSVPTAMTVQLRVDAAVGGLLTVTRVNRRGFQQQARGVSVATGAFAGPGGVVAGAAHTLIANRVIEILAPAKVLLTQNPLGSTTSFQNLGVWGGTVNLPLEVSFAGRCVFTPL